MSLASRISQARKDKGFTQEYVAASLGVSRQAVFKWEKGQARPDTKNLIGLSQLLGVSVDFLTSGAQIAYTTPLSVRPLRRWALGLLLIGLAVYLYGFFSGIFSRMVMIPVSGMLKIGVWFLWYGTSAVATVLLLVTLLFLFGALILALVAHYMNKK